MRFLGLLRANLGRRKIRTALTVGSFAVALFLFGLLAAIRSGFRQGIDIAGADRLVVISRTSIIQPLPVAHAGRLARVQGVEHVAHASWFGGIYQHERNFFPQFAVDAEAYRAMFPEFVVDEDEWRAFLRDRQGCFVGRKTARRFGWKVGDRIPLRGTIYEGAWELNLRGIYNGRRVQDDETQLWFHAKYLEENGPAWWKGFVGWYWVRVSDPDRAPEVAGAIDGQFANSPWETRTQTEQAFAASWVKQMGNVEFLILAVGTIVFFTLLLVTGNTMAISIRERTGELAVLKALGYSDRLVLGLVLAESEVMAVAGGVAGLSLAWWLVSARDLTQGIVLLYLPAAALLLGVLLAAVTGVLSVLVPAVGAMRLSVVDALRRV